MEHKDTLDQQKTTQQLQRKRSGSGFWGAKNNSSFFGNGKTGQFFTAKPPVVVQEKAESEQSNANDRTIGYCSDALQMRANLRTAAASGVVQRASVSTWAGTWKTEKYKGVNSKTATGLDIVLAFHPNKKVDAEAIGLTQGLVSMDAGTLNPINTTAAGRSIPAGEADAGFYIDRLHSKTNPIYGSSDLAAGTDISTTAADNNTSGKATKVGDNATYQLGYRYKDGKKTKVKKAALFDTPRRGPNLQNACQIFETTALAIDGAQKGDFYGSVQWGWQTDSNAKYKKLPLKLISEGVPSSRFLRAAELWNVGTSSTGAATTDIPTRGNIVVTNIPETDFLDAVGGKRIGRLAQGTRLEQTGNVNAPYSEVRVVDGRGNRKIMYRTGWVITAHFNDERP